jgi:hypothetical protein
MNQFKISEEDHKKWIGLDLSSVQKEISLKYPDLQIAVLKHNQSIFTNYFPRRCQIIYDDLGNVIDIIQQP